MDRESIRQVERKNNKLIEVRHKIKPKTTKVSDPDVKKHLEELHPKIVIATINKDQRVWHLNVVNTTVPNY